MTPAVSFRPDAGPVVVVGRPHSGSRALAGLLRAAGVFLGADLLTPQLDSASWFRLFVVPFVTSRYFPSRRGSVEDGERDRHCLDRINEVWHRYWHPDALAAPLWGWKYCESVFIVELLLVFFSGLRVVHLIRDGRDVCLSHHGQFQIGGPLADPPGWVASASMDRSPAGAGYQPTYERFCRAVTFLDADCVRWRGIDLADALDRSAHRYQLQMQAWQVSIEAARSARALLGERFIQVRYEDLCQNPYETASMLFGWLQLPWTDAAERFVAHSIEAGRVNAWRSARLSAVQRRDFDDACQLGAHTLTELGYAP